ncbi:MAG: chitobiase/beta-hexosaminidase C-terminal domain-containing protein [Oscillospiraceae bacterium]|nr:chitobiase/beta-hexosaminidase C-terminal domain-containing protein [Oscillospiraceae bacterium]
MKNLFKRIIASVLSVSILSSALPMTAFAEELNQPKKVELNDGYISVNVSTENGGFAIKTVDGNSLEKSDDNKELLYPSADYDTSYTSIRVTRKNGTVEDYIFGRSYGFLGLESSPVNVEKFGNTISATWSVKDITVKQTLGLLDEIAVHHGMVAVDYEVSTTATDVDNVKVRVMLDTALGNQDYGYYQVPNVLNEYSSFSNEQLIQNTGETEYNGTFFAIDDPKSPTVNAYTVDVAVGGKMVKPYQVAFGHWNSLASSVFDFAPDAKINFTNPYNAQYGTADSAYALYYDMGALQKDTPSRISTYYGVYTNSTVSTEESISINFTSVPTTMTMTEDKTAYISQVDGGRIGDIKFQVLLENVSDADLGNLKFEVRAINNCAPYSDWQFNIPYNGDYYTKSVGTTTPGQEKSLDIYFNISPLPASEYRRFEFICYNGTAIVGSREFHLLCPGVLGEVTTLNTISPKVVHYEGTRRLYLTGQNIGLMRDTTAYTAILHPVAGGDDVIVPAKNIVVDANNNSMFLVLEDEMISGAYQVIFDWIDPDKENTTSEALQFQVSDKPEYIAPTYGVVTIEKGEGYTELDPVFDIGIYTDEADYAKQVKDPNNTVFLEFRGNFGVHYDDDGNIVQVKASSLPDIYGNIYNTINISNCIEVEDGIVTLNVENYGKDDQCINVDIDGKVYTVKSRTRIWDGVCAITSFENGENSKLVQYKNDGTTVDDVENSTSNTNAITLLWPGAASAAQTLAGVMFEFRYCQFGMMATVPGSVNDSTPKQRVISFGAQMSPNFLLPKNFNWSERQSSPLEVAQMKLAKSNYNTYQLRSIEMRYKNDQMAWREAKRGSLSLYVDNILFGYQGFIGFDASIDVGIPSYADGLPEVSGKLDLRIFPATDSWRVGIEGVADLTALKMEARFALKKMAGGVPGVDEIYLYVEGSTPGINVDGFGVFWIQGLGGGLSGVYDTIYMVSKVPPLSLLLSGKFALFALLQARADLTLSMRGFEVLLSEIGITDGIELIEELGLEVRWYPDLYLRGHMVISIFDVINGGGYIILERNSRTDEIFWEGFAKASLQTPDLPLIGVITLASVGVGVNPQKIWGAFSIIGIDMGVTYYWGGDVDFGFGKYDAPEPTYPISLMSAPVGVDETTGQTLYMALGTNSRLVASTMPLDMVDEQSSDSKITSSTDRKQHEIVLGSYNSSYDMMMATTFTAANENEAKGIAMGDIYGNDGIKLVAKDDPTKTYELKWLDASEDADGQSDTNALFNYNEETGEGSVIISFTDEAAYSEEWILTSPSGIDVALYEMKRMGGIDSVDYTYNSADKQLDVDWSGSKLEQLDTVAIYAEATDGSMYPLYQTEDYTVISGGVADAVNGSATIDIPASLPSGEYKLTVVAVSEANNINDIVSSDATFTYVNPEQPEKPAVSNIALGGDYSIDADVTAGANTDGYVVTIYEETADGWAATEFGSQFIDADEDGTLPAEITVGGTYNKTVYTDADGNVVSAADADADGVTKTTVTAGLEAGKTYRIGVMAYNQTENNSELFSEEVFSSKIVMKKPVKPDVKVSVQDAKLLDDDTKVSDTIAYVADSEPVISISSDMAVSGKWTLDGDVQTGSFEANNSTTLKLDTVAEGEHTLTLTGENNSGDAFAVDHRFYVKTGAPRLQISSPASGTFFGNSVTVTGLADTGTVVTIMLDGTAVESVSTDESGTFSVTVPMDTTKLEQKISVYGENELGIETAKYNIYLTNDIMQTSDMQLAIYLNGEDQTYQTIPAGDGGKLELRAVSGDKTVVIPANSTLGSQAEWSVFMVEGTAALDNGQLTTDSNANGMLKVTLENQDLSAVIGGYEIEGMVRKPVIEPDGGEFNSTVKVTITCATEGAEIFYTTDGTTPTTSSTKYSGSFTLSETTTVKAIAVLDGVSSSVSTARFTKRSSDSGSGGGSYAPPIKPKKNPSINGIEMTWLEISAYIRNLPEVTEVTIHLNGNYDVPDYVTEAIDNKATKTTCVVDESRSWYIDGAKIETPAAADLSILTIASIDASALRGTTGIMFCVDGTNTPTELVVKADKKFADSFANLYKKDGRSLVFVDNIKIGANGEIILPVSEKSDYVIMYCEFSDRNGDTDNDGKLTLRDALLTLKYANGHDVVINSAVSDIDNNDRIDLKDALSILKLANNITV